jgi:hypothetical protein
MALSKDFIVKNGIQVSGVGSVPSTNTGTGALVVNGGIGVNGDIYAKNVYSQNNQVITTATLGSYGVSTISAGTDTAVSTSTGAVIVWNTSTLQSITSRGATTPSAISITNTTDATNTTSAALIVTGGIAAGASLVVGNGSSLGANNANYVKVTGAGAGNTVNINATGTDANVNLSLVTKGQGTIFIPAVTTATTTGTGALVVSGGAGFGGSVYAGNIFDNGNRVLTNVVLNSGPGITVANLGTVGSTISFRIDNTGVTATIGTTYLGVSSATGIVTFTNLGVQTLTAGTDTAVSSNTGTITVWTTSTLQSVTARGATTPSAISITSTATSNTSTNGALTVSGGVGIGGNLNVAGRANVYGPVTFSDTVTFSGTATYVLSTNTFYTDNILELHVPPGGVYGQWTVDDGKDIGFRFHYFNRTSSTDANAALVLADDSQALEWYGTGAESTGSTFTSATYGTFKTGVIQLMNTATNGNNATSGALQVAGGVGIGADLWVGGTGGVASNASVANQAFIVNAGGLGVNGDSYFANNVGIGGSEIVAGNLSVTGVTTSGSLLVTGTSVFNGNATANGTLGVASNFNVTGTSVLNGSVAANGNLGVAGNVIVTGTSVLNGITTITNQTVSSNTITGALVVTGGVGIGGSLNVGGNINVTGFINATINGITSTATNLGGSILGSVPYQSGIGQTSYFGPGTAGSVLVSSGGAGGIPPVFQNTLTLAGTTVALSTNTGAFQVVGGAGIGGNLFVGGNFVVTGTSIYVGATTLQGAVTANSTLGVAGNFNVTGTSLLSGTSVFNGNATANGTLGVAGNFNVTGTTTLSAGLNGTSATLSGNLGVTGTTMLVGGLSGTSAVLSGNLGVTGTSLLSGPVVISNATDSTSTTTGALTIAGGAGIRGNLWVGGDVDVWGTIRMQGVGLDTITGSTGTFVYVSVTGPGAALTVTNSMTVGQQITAGSLNVLGQSTLSNVTANISTITTLIVTGNEVVNGNLGVATNFNVTGTTVLNGSATANGNLFVNNALAVTGTSVLNGNVAANGNLGVGGNLNVTGTSVLTGAVTVQGASQYSAYASPTTSTSAVITLDSFVATTYRTAKYVCQVVDNGTTPNKVQVEEFLVFHDNYGSTTTAYIISYGIGTNTGEMGTWDAVYAGGNVSLQFTPNYTPTALVVKTVRTSITT